MPQALPETINQIAAGHRAFGPWLDAEADGHRAVPAGLRRRGGAFSSERSKTWHWQPEGQTRLMAFLNYAGVGPRPSSVTETHKYGYDFETLAFLLHRVGFCEVTRAGYTESWAKALRVDQDSAVAGTTYGGRHYLLFILEAASCVP